MCGARLAPDRSRAGVRPPARAHPRRAPAVLPSPQPLRGRAHVRTRASAPQAATRRARPDDELSAHRWAPTRGTGYAGPAEVPRRCGAAVAIETKLAPAE